ncbi:unannotated protein [freshwater metagenome]|uniref:Unannotated protein n=1 Tax=freshwater metagenome TaxID=449393 RepID=A0A6J7NSS9_9ZZZZ
MTGVIETFGADVAVGELIEFVEDCALEVVAPEVFAPGELAAVTEVVEALALGSSFAFAKSAPPKIIDPAATIAAMGNFLLILRIPEDALSASESSNHSGLLGVIGDPFR